MGSRAELSSMLHEFTSNVYFQPPESIKLSYPCIVYSMEGDHISRADNSIYSMKQKYTVTYITKDPDSEVVNRIREKRYCSLNRIFTSDNLYHYVFNIFY